jgi:transposase
MFVGIDVSRDRLDVHLRPAAEATVAAALAAAGLPLAVVNPAQVRAFAKAVGRLAETGRLDAELIARFAEQVRPTPRPVASEQVRTLAELVARRRQLVPAANRDIRRAQADSLLLTCRRARSRKAGCHAWTSGYAGWASSSPTPASTGRRSASAG